MIFWAFDIEYSVEQLKLLLNCNLNEHTQLKKSVQCFFNLVFENMKGLFVTLGSYFYLICPFQIAFV